MNRFLTEYGVLAQTLGWLDTVHSSHGKSASHASGPCDCVPPVFSGLGFGAAARGFRRRRLAAQGAQWEGASREVTAWLFLFQGLNRSPGAGGAVDGGGGGGRRRWRRRGGRLQGGRWPCWIGLPLCVRIFALICAVWCPVSGWDRFFWTALQESQRETTILAQTQSFVQANETFATCEGV